MQGMCTPLNIFIEVNHLLHKTVPFLERHEEVLLSRGPAALIRIKGTYTDTWTSFPIDQLEPVLVVIIFIKGPYQTIIDRHN